MEAGGIANHMDFFLDFSLGLQAMWSDIYCAVFMNSFFIDCIFRVLCIVHAFDGIFCGFYCLHNFIVPAPLGAVSFKEIYSDHCFCANFLFVIGIHYSDYLD